MLMILYLLPVFLQLALLPFWFFLENCATLSAVLIIVNAVVVPLYLSIISAKKKNHSFANSLISFVICIMCSFVKYCNWGISTGYFFEPDSITILIVKTEIIIAGVILSIIFVIRSK